jgi:DNA-binding NtrC family response regulator
MVIPPLRERAGDVAVLLRHFLPPGWRIEPAAQAALVRYLWPGNVRQLRNVLDRATILATGDVVTVDDLPSELFATASATMASSNNAKAATDHSLETWERSHVEKILQACGGNKSEAAHILGIHRRKLYRLLERLGIKSS